MATEFGAIDDLNEAVTSGNEMSDEPGFANLRGAVDERSLFESRCTSLLELFKNL